MPSTVWLLDVSGAGHIFGDFGFPDAFVQRIVDFSRVGPEFKLSFNAAAGSGGSFGAIDFRIGGTFNELHDGTVVWSLATSAAAFAEFGGISPPITNIWTGQQLVKVTADVFGSGGFVPTVMVVSV